MTCEQCGADAMDAGVCQNCGWRAPVSHPGSEANADLQAETREADIPARARRPVTARNFGPPTPLPGALPPASAGVGGGAPVTPRMASRTSPGGPSGPSDSYGGPGPATSRFCGTCGARLEAGQLFCGQCGAAVSTFEGSGVNHPTSTNHPGYSSPRFGGEDTDAWSPADQDAPTEQWAPIQGGFGRAPAYRASGAYPPAAPLRGMSRELRILLGIFCILGALISGAGAIILAFVK